MKIIKRLHVDDFGELPVRESAGLLVDFVVGRFSGDFFSNSLRVNLLYVSTILISALVFAGAVYFDNNVPASILISLIVTFGAVGVYRGVIDKAIHGHTIHDKTRDLCVDEAIRNFKKTSLDVNDKYVKNVLALETSENEGDDKFVVVEFKRKSYLKNSLASLYKQNIESQLIPDLIGVDLKAKKVLLKTNELCKIASVGGVNLAKGDSNILSDLIEQMHFLNVTGISPLLVQTGEGKSFVVSVGNVDIHKKRNSAFYVGKNDDNKRLNKRFSLNLMTKGNALDELSNQRKKYEFLYSSAYFFNGIGFGIPWAKSHGYGRWLYILRDALVPQIKGKIVLDLGSNTGILPMYMLRGGAKKVIAVEKDPLNAETMGLYKKIFEWQDDRTYDLSINNMNMLDVMQEKFKEADVVTALCSIYYITEDEIETLMTWVYENVGTLIIESNEDSRVDGRNDKAKLRYLAMTAESVGFKNITFFEPSGFSRPLFVAKR